MLLQEFNSTNYDSINAPYPPAVPKQISGNWDLLQPHRFAEVSTHPQVSFRSL